MGWIREERELRSENELKHYSNSLGDERGKSELSLGRKNSSDIVKEKGNLPKTRILEDEEQEEVGKGGDSIRETGTRGVGLGER